MRCCVVHYGALAAGLAAGVVVGEGGVWGVNEMVLLMRCCDCRFSSYSADARRWFIGDRVGRVRLRCDERGAERWKMMDWIGCMSEGCCGG